MAGDFRGPTAQAAPGYTAASTGRRARGWRVLSMGPNSVTLMGLDLIRNRARGAARNDPWAGVVLDKLVSNAIGTGIEARELWGNADQKKAQKRLWKRWSKVCDADGVLDFSGLQALWAREQKEAGEVFVRKRRRRLTDGLPVPLQLQTIEAEQCPSWYYGTASNGNAIRAGIEFDLLGRRAAYWMHRTHPGDYDPNVANGSDLVRVPADQILHLFEPLRAGQIRGIPQSASVLMRMYNLDSLDDAVLERQKIANLFAGFFETSAGADDEDTVADMETGTAHDGMPEAGLEPGTMQDLPPGKKAVFSDPPDVGSNYADLLRGGLQAIAARNGVPYEVMTGDLRNVSDRALRLILNEFRRVIEQWQWLLIIPQLLQPVREAFFDAGVLAGALDLPGYAEQRDDIVETLWVPQGWPYSHPVQDVDADIKAIRAGLGSRTGVNLANGEDSERIDAEQASDNERADSAGLAYDSDGRRATSGAKTAAATPTTT